MNEETKDYILVANSIQKSFINTDESLERICILNNVNFKLRRKDKIGIIGSSGCGKTTLLQIIGLLDKPDSGELYINGKNCTCADDKIKCNILSRDIGFIYQFHHLLPEFTALENIAIGCDIAGIPKKEAIELSTNILEEIGLYNKRNALPSALSGGERQRVAIGRAIAKRPKIILADEPTGNLDPNTGEIVVDLLLKMIEKFDLSMVCVTHNHKFAEKMPIIEMQSLHNNR